MHLGQLHSGMVSFQLADGQYIVTGQHEMTIMHKCKWIYTSVTVLEGALSFCLWLKFRLCIYNVYCTSNKSINHDREGCLSPFDHLF